jgi:hypothetical protein
VESSQTISTIARQRFGQLFLIRQHDFFGIPTAFVIPAAFLIPACGGITENVDSDFPFRQIVMRNGIVDDARTVTDRNFDSVPIPGDS